MILPMEIKKVDARSNNRAEFSAILYIRGGIGMIGGAVCGSR